MDLLMKIREAEKLSQREAAQKLGISQQMWSAIEVGYRKPSVELAKKIAQVFNFEKYNLQWHDLFPDTA